MSKLSTAISCILLLPDAVESDTVPSIGQWLTGHNVAPLLAKPVRLTKADFRSIYGNTLRSKTSEKGRLYGRLLTNSLFESGQSIAVIVRGKPGLSEFLNEMKGVSSYSMRPHDDFLRNVSSNCDRGQSLLHTPDSQPEAELLIGFFWGAVPAGLRARKPLQWEDIARLRSTRAFSRFDARYRGVVILMVRLHLAAVLDSSRADSDLAESGRRNLEVLEAWLTTSPSGNYTEELRRFERVLSELRTSDDPSIFNIDQLLDSRTYCYEVGLDIIATAKRLGLTMTKLEEQDLLTTFTFFEQN
ncbi:MAG: hypothetical protein ACRDDJ_16035 [[Mycobacterium] stephanolepidis]